MTSALRTKRRPKITCRVVAFVLFGAVVLLTDEANTGIVRLVSVHPGFDESERG